MNFKECDIDEFEYPRYADLYAALVKAHESGKAIEVELGGLHPGTITNALRQIHKGKSNGTRVASRRKPESNALVVYLDKDWPSK